MSLKLACADFTFPLLSHAKALDLIALLELPGRGVDIGLFEQRSHLQPSKLFVQAARSARELKKKLDDRGLKLADMFLQAAPEFVSMASNHPDARRRAKGRRWFEQTLELAQRCQGRHVSGLPGVFFEGESKARSWGRCLEEMAWRLERAREAGLIFSIEAHVGSLTPSPASALRLVQSVPGLTLTLDYTHFTRRGMPDSAMEPLLPYASHFHCRGARKGRLQTSLRHNTIDYQRIFRQLTKRQYAGYIGLEYVWIDWEHCNEVDNVAETIQFRDFFSKLAGR